MTAPTKPAGRSRSPSRAGPILTANSDVDEAMRKFIHQAVNTKASRGFTLLEALIALLVLSIGLLGLAGLQASSARLGHEAHMRSITTMAASEIIEKIRMRTAKISRKVRPA